MKETKVKMTERYVADTYAFMEVQKGNSAYAALVTKEWVATHSVLAELYYSLLRVFGHETAYATYLKNKSRAIVPNDVVIVRAMQFKLENKKDKLSYTDCLGYALAMELGIPFLTGDKKFKGKKNVKFVV